MPEPAAAVASQSFCSIGIMTKASARLSVKQCALRNAALQTPVWLNRLNAPILFLPAKKRCSRQLLERRNKMNAMKSYANWRNYRNAVSELSGLSNRSLADLGIARADIRAVARRAAQ